MENTINEMVDNFKGNLQDFFLNGKRSLAEKESKIRAYLKKLHALGWSEPTAEVVAPV